MRPLARVSVYYIAAVAALLGYSLAFAADGGISPEVVPVVADPPVNWMMAVPLITLILSGAAGSIRSWTPTDGFFHTKIGHAVIALAGFIIGGATSFLQAGHFTKYAAFNALLGAGSAWAMSFKTDGKMPTDVVAEPTKTNGGGAA